MTEKFNLQDAPGAIGVGVFLFAPLIVSNLWKQYTYTKKLKDCAQDLKEYSSGVKKPLDLSNN